MTLRTQTQSLDMNLEDQTEAINIATRMTDDELVINNEDQDPSEEQPELFI